MSTKSDLRDQIKQESRIQTNANLDSMVDRIVADIMRDYCNLARYYELLLEDVPITLVAGQSSYARPADFQNLQALRYGIGSTPTYFKELRPKTDTVKRTYTQGLPLFYRLTKAGFSIFPFSNIAATDMLFMDYYVDPASLYLTDDAEFPVPQLESAVKKSAIARVQRFHSSDTEAGMTGADSGSSFNASNADSS